MAGDDDNLPMLPMVMQPYAPRHEDGGREVTRLCVDGTAVHDFQGMPVCRCGFRGVETTLPPMLSDDMKKALRRAGRKVKDATVERDELVRQAVEAGGSLREVGEAVGLTHTAVKFIAHGRPPK